MIGDDVDLFKLPIPMSSIYDGGPMITAGVVIAQGPRARHQLAASTASSSRKRTSPASTSSRRTTCGCSRSARCERGEPLPDLDLDRHASVRDHGRGLSRAARRRRNGDRRRACAASRSSSRRARPSTCPTSPTPRSCWRRKSCRPAGPSPEGRFGEFTRLMGGLHWNPLVRIKAIAMRKDAIYYDLHMPWENTWLAAPTRYTAIRQALKTAGRAGQRTSTSRSAAARSGTRSSRSRRQRRRRQERAARRAVGDGPQACRRGRRRHRRQRPDRRGMGDRHARAGRQGRHDHSGRAGEAARPEPAAWRRAWCRSAPKSASTRRSRSTSRRSTTSASPTPMPTPRRSTTT